MVDPALNAGVQFRECNGSVSIEVKITLEPLGKVYHVSPLQKEVVEQ